MLAAHEVNYNVENANDKFDFIDSLVANPHCEDTFHIVNIGVLVNRLELWNEHLPNVKPYYAIKTNNDKMIVKTLAILGTGFDCASQNEIEQALALGVDPEKIIFAHPRRPLHSIHFAKEKGVDLLTFDSIEELEKILKIYPEVDLVLRIKTDDSQSSTQLSKKFGASLNESYEILDYAFQKNANIVGIAFHVGSNCSNLSSYEQAIKDASTLFSYSNEKYERKLTLLDLGGGWSGTDDTSFISIAKAIQDLLQDRFPKDTVYIAEPGRYFSAGTTTLVMKIHGKKRLMDENKIAYYLSNGVFGFFISSVYYDYNPEKIMNEGWIFTHLPSRKKVVPLIPALLWGPTCDSGDKIIDGILLPDMNTGDFIAVENLGAYTYSLETSFNGIPLSKPYYIYEIRE